MNELEGMLHIKARLPRSAGLELCARLLADRPYWDIEAEEDGLSFVIPLKRGKIDEDLGLLEECCRNGERLKNGLEIVLDIKRIHEKPAWPSPSALGPWDLLHIEPWGHEQPRPENKQLFLPPAMACSKRLWVGEALLLTAIADHMSPPPGAPETKGKAALIMESVMPLAPLAALEAGADSVSLITDEQSAAVFLNLMAVNRVATERMECLSSPFKSLSRQRHDWNSHFSLIAVHLSPYLSSRRLKSLSRWLHPAGVLLIGGFAPGRQTAQLLRSAARAGLELSYSLNDGDWAVMQLRAIPFREELPPLTGSVVPELVALPPEEKCVGEEPATTDDLNSLEKETAQEREMPDEDSLLVEIEDEDE